MGRDSSQGASDNPNVLPFVLIQGPPGLPHQDQLWSARTCFCPVVLFDDCVVVHHTEPEVTAVLCVIMLSACLSNDAEKFQQQ